MLTWPGPIPGSGRGNLSGQSSGSLSAEGRKNGWEISGESHFKGIFADDRLRVEISSGKVDLNWDGKGLLAAAALKLNQGGTLEGRAIFCRSLSTNPSPGRKTRGPLEGNRPWAPAAFSARSCPLKRKEFREPQRGMVCGVPSRGSRQDRDLPRPVHLEGRAKAHFHQPEYGGSGLCLARRGDCKGIWPSLRPIMGALKGRFLLPLSARFSSFL